MRVALVTPYAAPSVRGNAVTVERLARGLSARGVAVEVIDLSRVPDETAAEWLARAAPDVVHAFHAYRVGRAVTSVVRDRHLPLVLSLTGTDANHDLYHPDRRDGVLATLGAARAVVVFHESIRDRVAAEAPALAGGMVVIPQSVRLGDQPCQIADVVPPGCHEVRFLLPAGIRRVKNVLFPLVPLGVLARRYPLRLLIVGPVIEEDEGARLRAALKDLEWASYLGEVPHAQMGALLRSVDVVINSSLSEGGMANSVLEAMSCGRAVLASDIEGNRSVVEHGVDGLLFREPGDLERMAERLIADRVLRARLGEAARAKIARRYPPGPEIEAYLTLYRRVATAGEPAWR